MTRPSQDPGGSGLWWGTGAAALCCLVPVLIAGGALARGRRSAPEPVAD